MLNQLVSTVALMNLPVINHLNKSFALQLVTNITVMAAKARCSL